MNKFFGCMLFFSFCFSATFPTVNSADLADVEIIEHSHSWVKMNNIDDEKIFTYSKKKNINLEKEINDKIYFLRSIDHFSPKGEKQNLSVLKYSLSRILYDKEIYKKTQKSIELYLASSKTCEGEDKLYCQEMLQLIKCVLKEEFMREKQIKNFFSEEELEKIFPKAAKGFELIDAITDTLPFQKKKDTCCML